MKNPVLPMLVLGAVLSGCAQTSPVREYATVYFSSPDGSKVRVFEYSDRETGYLVTDYVDIEGPVTVLVGKLWFTFACPQSLIATYENKTTVEIEKPGEYYLHCDETEKLLIDQR